MSDTMSILALLVAIAIGSGGGGIVGSVMALRRLRMEQEAARAKQRTDLAAVDVDHFKAMFPGGLGDAVEHWRDEAKALYEEVDELRALRAKDHDDYMVLRQECDDTKRELATTKLELARANERIAHLEGMLS